MALMQIIAKAHDELESLEADITKKDWKKGPAPFRPAEMPQLVTRKKEKDFIP